MTTTRTHRAVATAASLAVAAAGLAGFAPAATAAVTGAEFTCTVPALGATPFLVDADATFPATVRAGAPANVKFEAKVTIPEDVASLAAALFGPKVSGTADIKGSFGGSASVIRAAVPMTDAPASGSLVIPVQGTANLTAKAPGTVALSVSEFDANLVFHKADGSKQDLAVPCAAKTPVTVATTTVAPAVKPPTQAKAKSVTVAKAKYAKKKRTVTASATVKASGKAASGKVKFTLKRGKKVVNVSTKTLDRKGAAKATFKRVSKKGSYTLTAQYKGNKNVKASKKVVKLKVK